MRPFALWLLPAEPDPFQTIIDRLSRSLGGPSFQAHLTLHSGYADHEAVVTTAAAKLSPIGDLRLAVRGLSGEDSFFRRFYLEMLGGPALDVLAGKAAVETGTPLRPNRTPHISLFYGDQRPPVNPDEFGLKGLEQVSFNQVVAVFPTADDWSAVADWRVVGPESYT